jgi:uncharacterized damage-inducible protein DinB
VTSLLGPEFVPGGSGWQPFVPTNRRELLAGFARFADEFRTALAGCSDDVMQAEWRIRKGERILWTCPRQVAMRTMVLHHVIHHRGQLTVYLRLLGVPVPSTYGPTADVAI